MSDNGNPVSTPPVANPRTGGTTLASIAKSRGADLGRPQTIPADAVQSDRDKEILSKAIPADRFEQVLFTAKQQTGRVTSAQPSVPLTKTYKPARGTMMYHTKKNCKVVVIAPDASVDEKGRICHQVMLVGSAKKIMVAEEKLIPYDRTKHRTHS